MSDELLTERHVVKLLRERYLARIRSFCESSQSNPFLSPGLLLKCKKTGVKFKIESIDDTHGSAVLSSPEGKEFSMSLDDIAANYFID